MFSCLDEIFPADITNLILGFLSEKYLVDPKKHSRIYLKKVDRFNFPVPKPIFTNAVWTRRYYNPYTPEGVKLAAFGYSDLPVKRIPFILSRSYLKLRPRICCACPGGWWGQNRTHWYFHWVDAMFSKLSKKSSVEIERAGWNLSIPVMIYILANDLGPCEFFFAMDRFRTRRPDFLWNEANYLLFRIHPIDMAPVHSAMWNTFGLFIQ